MERSIELIVEKTGCIKGTRNDAIELRESALCGNTCAALVYGYCLFHGYLVGKDVGQAYEYVKLVYAGGQISELVDLADFCKRQGGKGWMEIHEMCLEKATQRLRFLDQR